MKDATFNFEPITLANLSRKKSRQKGVTVNIQRGTIIFSKQYIEDNHLAGKYIKFFVDTKKLALGWSLIEKTSFLTDLKEYKQIKLGKAKVYLLSIATAVKQFNFSVNVKTFKGLQVKKYLCQYNSQPRTIYYVILKYNETKK